MNDANPLEEARALIRRNGVEKRKEILRLLELAREDEALRPHALALEGSWRMELAQYDEALRVADALCARPESWSQAKGHNLRGAVNLQQGDYAAAYRLFVTAVERYGPNAARDVAFVENNLGLLCTRIGDNEGAVTHYRRAVTSFVRGGDRLSAARVRANLGIALNRLDQTEEALATFRAALEELDDDPNWEANVQGSLADLYTDQGQYELAERLLRQALVTRKRMGQGRQLAGGEIALAGVLLKRGMVEECREHVDRGLTRARALGLRESVADGLEVLAELLAHEGRFEEAYLHRLAMSQEREELRAVELQRIVVEARGRASLEEARANAAQREAEAEELRRANALAERALRARSEFVATTSHELRGPLTAVLGACEILSLDPPTPESKKLIDLALSSARLLQGVVGDVLELSRLDAGEVLLAREVLLIRELVYEVAGLAQASGPAPIRLTMDESVPDLLIGDDARVRQVLLNVIDNAVKYTARGEVKVSVSFRLDNLYVRVQDEGPGIPEAFIPRLFEPFARAPEPFVRARRGTGLGLSIVSRLCEVMEGTVELVHTDADGSTFEITLPLIEATDATTPRMPPRAAVTCAILLVEDDPVVSEVVGSMLRVIGHRVEHAASAEQAEEVLGRWRPDLVISDHRMPGATGLDLAKRWAARLPFVILSGEVSSELRSQAEAAGVRRVLSKPVGLATLRELTAER